MQFEFDFADVIEKKHKSASKATAAASSIPPATDVVTTALVEPAKPASRLEKRFDKLWRQLENKQNRNNSFEEEYEKTRQWIHNDLADHRKLYKRELLQQTEKLISHLAKKSLAKWQREELGSWIEDNFQLLEIHGAAELPELGRKYFEAKMASLNEGERDYIQQILDESDQLMAEMDLDDDLDDDLNDDSEFIDDDFEDWSEGATEEEHDHSRSRDNYYEEVQFEAQKKKKLTFDKSIVSKLFRRTAKALHPDHEQDPVRREEKQALMKNLLEARKSGNIAMIFKLYREHVDNATITIDLPELQPMIDLLIQQIEELDQQYQQKSSQSPMHDWVSNHIVGKPEKRRLAALAELKRDLEDDIKRTKQLHPYLASLAKLKPLLEERYEQHLFSYF